MNKRSNYSFIKRSWLLAISILCSFDVALAWRSDQVNWFSIGVGRHRGSFVIISDIHEELERLRDAISWVNSHRESEKIMFIVVLGDWTYEGVIDYLEPLKAILDNELDNRIKWVPLIGNHEVYTKECEQAFDKIFKPHIQNCGFPMVEIQPTPKWNKEIGDYSWFQNYAFDVVCYNPSTMYHFVCLDWSDKTSRTGWLGEDVI